MDLSAGALIASLLVGGAGFSFFVYGKKQLRIPQLVVGLSMMTYPYFISSPIWVWSIAALLVLGLVVAIRSGL